MTNLGPRSQEQASWREHETGTWPARWDVSGSTSARPAVFRGLADTIADSVCTLSLKGILGGLVMAIGYLIGQIVVLLWVAADLPRLSGRPARF